MKMLGKFRRDENATMTMEFAIVAPLLFIVIIAGFEFFDAFKSYGRAAKVTYTIADNLSRREEIDETEIVELHALMNALLPWMNGDKSLTVTSVIYDETDGYICDWSKPSKVVNVSTGALGIDFKFALNSKALSTPEIADVLPTIANGDSIILVETAIPHRTLFSMFGLEDLVWFNQVAIRPRFTSKLADVSKKSRPCK